MENDKDYVKYLLINTRTDISSKMKETSDYIQRVSENSNLYGLRAFFAKVGQLEKLYNNMLVLEEILELMEDYKDENENENGNNDMKLEILNINTTNLHMNSETGVWGTDAYVHIKGRGAKLISDIGEQLQDFKDKFNKEDKKKHYTHIGESKAYMEIVDYIAKLTGHKPNNETMEGK